MTVAAVQLPPCTADVAANLGAVDRALHDAARAGARLVVLPELCTTPYFAGLPAGACAQWAEPVDGELVAHVAARAASLEVVVVLPFYERDPRTGGFHNAAVVLDASGVVPAVDRGGIAHPVARKLHLPVGRLPAPGFDEPAHFTPGSWLGVHDLGPLRLGVLICYDRRFPECWRELRALGADVVAVPVAGSGGDSVDFFHAELRTHARENGVFAIAANKIGTEFVADQAVDNFGASSVVDPEGELIACAGDRSGPLLAELDLAAVARTRAALPYFEHRRTDLLPSAEVLAS